MSRKPSLRDLENLDRNRRAEAHRSDLVRRATKYGLDLGRLDLINIWKLMRAVHDYECEHREWPETQRRAAARGISTKGKTWKDNTNVSLACYDADRYNELRRRYPDERTEPAEGRPRGEDGHLAKAWRAVLLRLRKH